jgi:hypothetical protein
MKEGFQGLPNASRLVDWRMPGSNGSGIPERCRFPNLITLQYCDPCPALRQEVSATDSNYAAAHDGNVTIS